MSLFPIIGTLWAQVISHINGNGAYIFHSLYLFTGYSRVVISICLISLIHENPSMHAVLLCHLSIMGRHVLYSTTESPVPLFPGWVGE